MTWVNNGCMSYKPGPGQAMQAELEALTIGSANGETGVTESFLNIYMPYNQLLAAQDSDTLPVSWLVLELTQPLGKIRSISPNPSQWKK